MRPDQQRADGIDSNGLPVTVRNVRVEDAAPIHALVSAAGELDVNSCYCYLLICRDFCDTCLVAHRKDDLLGVITAYRPPRDPETLFVWQVGVARHARRQGIGRRLLRELVTRPACRDVKRLEATVTRSNVASRQMFQAFAAEWPATCQWRSGFPAGLFGPQDPKHEAEQRLCIEPLQRMESPRDVGNVGHIRSL